MDQLDWSPDGLLFTVRHWEQARIAVLDAQMAAVFGY
jgi:hypothetical protein